MQKTICYWVAPAFQQDLMFKQDFFLNRDNCLEPFRLMQEEFQKHGWAMHTQDYFFNNQITPDAVLFMEIPKKTIQGIIEKWEKTVPYAIICECEAIMPHNWTFTKHEQFKKIFTWRDDLVDNKKYFWTKDSPCLVNPVYRKTIFADKKLCTLINSNKTSLHPSELYSKRVEVIAWFEKHHPNDFDFYGYGWDKKKFRYPLLKPLNRVPFLSHLLRPRFKCYKGSVTLKYAILDQYKFAICFENAKNICGYFTEKLFDCFLAGCVPIYQGASNITDYIPKNCFIDFNDFSSMQELYAYLKQMPEEEYQQYLNNIDCFINAKEAEIFKPEYFAKTIYTVIAADFAE